jgi:hypothetical protein
MPALLLAGYEIILFHLVLLFLGEGLHEITLMNTGKRKAV